MGKYVMVKQVAVVVVATAMLVGCSSSEEAPNNDSPVVETSHEVGAAPSQTYVTSAEEGEAQRSWPRRFFDDSSYRPGTWSVTPQGDPLYVPDSPLGEPLGKPTENDEISECIPDSVRVPNKVNLQYVHGRFLLFSDTDGPGGVQENGILKDYSQTPAGAVVAAANFLSYVTVASDGLGRAADRELLLSDESLYGPGQGSGRGMMPPAPPPDAFKVHSCAGNIITLSLAIGQPLRDDGSPAQRATWLVPMLTMRWDKGQWKVMVTDEKNKYGDDAIVHSLDGWTELKYQ
ncbi:hypothetical protein [Corynebacterium oculi]|uniref:DUF8175 domain-containing protein n=1 Tax=Corynebacterium oculi TaxID=1544416 RepID=A0A0Q0YCV8_9CORY|nr:hypothetical protein [Corynebacterium oculi]KQB84076.1 hypothetical protein Cocul_00872 [Corynebacterium oculi]